MRKKEDKYDFRALGLAIKEARKKQGLTREQVGAMIEIDPRYLTNIENKGQHPSVQIFLELIERYHVSVDQILFGEEADGKTTARRQLDALADDLNDTEIGIIIATAQALLNARKKGE